MNKLHFSTIDNFNLPIIITDSDGIIIHRNKAAAHAVKIPRRSANILNYISDKDIDLKGVRKNMGFKRFYHDSSVYTHAFSYPFKNGEEDLWMWIFSLKFNDFDSSNSLELSFLADLSDCIVEYISTSDSSLSINSPVDMRFNESLFRLLRAASFSLNQDNRFRVYDVIDTVCKITKETSLLYGKKLVFNTSFLDPANFTNISFESFTNIFMHTIITMLRISNYKPMEITFSQFSAELNMTIYLVADNPICELVHGDSLTDLFPVFHENHLNLLVLDTIAKHYDYHIEYTFERRDGHQFLELIFSTSLAKNDMLLHSPNKMVSQLLFNICRSKYEQNINKLLQTI